MAKNHEKKRAKQLVSKAMFLRFLSNEKKIIFLVSLQTHGYCIESNIVCTEQRELRKNDVKELKKNPFVLFCVRFWISYIHLENDSVLFSLLFAYKSQRWIESYIHSTYATLYWPFIVYMAGFFSHFYFYVSILLRFFLCELCFFAPFILIFVFSTSFSTSTVQCNIEMNTIFFAFLVFFRLFYFAVEGWEQKQECWRTF